MYSIIGGDQKEYGPITAEQLRQWIAEGRVNSETRVRSGVDADWQAISALPEFAHALRLQNAPPALDAGNLPPPELGVWRDQVLARQPRVEIGKCLRESWSLLTTNFGVLFGATALAWGIALACQFVPLVGGIVNWLIQGVLYGGLYLIFLNRIRGRPAAAGDVFAGFSAGFVQLMLAGLLTKMLAYIGLCCCLFLPGVYLFVAWIFSVPLVADKRLEFWSAMELSRKVVTRIWFQMLGLIVVAFLPVILMYIFIQIRIAFAAYPILQELTTSGPPDVEHLSQLVIRIARISLPLGLLFKLILLLNLPFGIGALMYAYEGVFGTRTPAAA